MPDLAVMPDLIGHLSLSLSLVCHILILFVHRHNPFTSNIPSPLPSYTPSNNPVPAPTNRLTRPYIPSSHFLQIV